MSWVAKKRNDILEININAKQTTKWEQWVLLRSDAHWDNIKSDRDLQRQHLEKAKRRNAIVLDGGDLFCAMQGKYDPRSSKSAIRQEHNKTNYLDALVNTATKWHQPYADQFAMLAHGNHETSIYERQGTDLTARLARNLDCHAVPITGFVRMLFHMNTQRHSYLLHYHHGYGGGGPVTKGVIQAARKAAYLPEADIVWGGHVHEAWHMVYTRLTVSNDGHVQKRLQHHVTTPTYKDDYAKGASNWSNIKGFPPKPLGCIWLRFFYYCKRKTGESKQKTTHRRVGLEIIPELCGDKLEGE